jgi:hypothetical protein
MNFRLDINLIKYWLPTSGMSPKGGKIYFPSFLMINSIRPLIYKLTEKRNNYEYYENLYKFNEKKNIFSFSYLFEPFIPWFKNDFGFTYNCIANVVHHLI